MSDILNVEAIAAEDPTRSGRLVASLEHIWEAERQRKANEARAAGRPGMSSNLSLRISFLT